MNKWYLESGHQDDIVISTRIRLARNFHSIPFPSKMTEQDFAQNFDDKGQQSLDDYNFFDGAVWERAIDTLKISYGAEYHKVGDYVWESDYLEGYFITATVNENGYLSEVVYTDANTNKPVQKYVYQYGGVVLPELPDYKNAN